MWWKLSQCLSLFLDRHLKTNVGQLKFSQEEPSIRWAVGKPLHSLGIFNHARYYFFFQFLRHIIFILIIQNSPYICINIGVSSSDGNYQNSTHWSRQIQPTSENDFNTLQFVKKRDNSRAS